MKYLRTCVICGDQFIATVHNKTVCDKDHYHPCPVCGRDVLSNKQNRQNCTCSKECGRIVAKGTRTSTLKRVYHVDSLGQIPSVRLATSERNSRTKRKDPVYSSCVICDKPIKLRWPYDPDKQKTCSKECRSIYLKTSGIAKARADKAKRTLIDRHHVSNAKYLQHFVRVCTYCGKEFETDDARRVYCYDVHYGPCPACGNQVAIREMSIGPQACSEKCRQHLISITCLERYGSTCVVNSDYAHELAVQTNMQKLGVPHQSQSKEFHMKSGRTRCSTKASDGTYLDSKYEVSVYEFATKLDMLEDRQIPFDYTYNKSRKLFIDFKLDGRLFECKGGHIIGGVYSKSDPIHALLKLQLYGKLGAVIITDKYGFDCVAHSTDPIVHSLVCVDIELFRNVNEDYLLRWNRIISAIDSGIQFIDIASI